GSSTNITKQHKIPQYWSFEPDSFTHDSAMDAQETAAATIGAHGGRQRQLPTHLQGYKVSLPQSLLPNPTPLQYDSARQLRSLSLQTGLAAESDQLHTAIGRPPSYSLPGATNKANLWDMAPYASSMPDLQNMCVVPRLPSPSEQSCHSHQSSEYSLSENGSGPLSSHPPPTHSNWLDSQADNRILQQQPLSIQLGQATKHQDKLLTTTLLCTTTATFQSQALSAFMPSQKQERSILTQSLPPTVTSARLLGAVSKPTAILARSTVMSSPIVQGMQAAGHVGQQLPTTTRYQPYQPVPPPVATMYGSMQAAT
ncbi:hypothetical protein NQZ68_036930, partial [Dissostichus eleginoides]